MNTMEEILWSYIDGSCTADEKKAIDILIAQDEAYRRKYDELLVLNQEFANMELDEPSMAFTYNVMESIRAEHAQQPLKAGIDKRIIKSIAGFFIVSILLLLIYVISTTPVGHVSFSGHAALDIKLPDLKNYFNVHLLEAFFFFDLVLGLFLFDTYLRKRGMSKHVN
jgi:hypothetical protein